MSRLFSAILVLLISVPGTCLSQDSPKRLRGICFSSVRDNESPARLIQPLPSAVNQDVAFASQLAKSIRTYTVAGSSYLIPEFCKKNQVDCIVGAWIGPLAWQNEAQLELLAQLTRTNNDRIKALIIGNEVLHRGDLSESQLIEYIRRIKSQTTIPVASADTWRAWTEHPKLAEAVDICGVQIYPFWEGRSIEGAAEYTVQRVLEMKQLYPNKRIMLTEFGWPTQGETLGQAEASPANAARYLREILPLLDQHDIEYFYFSVWDENWKVGPEGSVGAHWGLFESNGTIKPAFESLLPSNVATQTRPPRTMTFQLESDQERNQQIAEVAFGPREPDSETPQSDDGKELDANQQTVAGQAADAGAPLQAGQRGVGLDVPNTPAIRNPYAGLRPFSKLKDSRAGLQAAGPNDNPGRIEPKEPTAVPDNDLASDAGESTPAANDAELQDNSQRAAIRAKRNARPPLGPNELYGVCLSLFRDEETPHFGIMPLVSEIREDVSYAAKIARAVRTYSVTDSFAFVPSICDDLEIACFPGASLGKYPWLNDLELEMLIRIGQADHPSIEALIVGNEVMHRGDFSAEQYVQYIRRVKKRVRVPVATAELLHSWMEHPELAEEVDILGVQIYPYWGGVSIDEAATNTLDSIRQLQARFPDKRIILTEFGWPTAGGTIGQAVASPENAARYLREVIPLLNENKIEYLYFAMTDEKWKQRDEGGPGPHWGLLSSDGRPKIAFQALLPSSAIEGFERSPRTVNFKP